MIHFGGLPDEEEPWHPASRGVAAPFQPAGVGAVTSAPPVRKNFDPRSLSERNGTHYKLTIQAFRQGSNSSQSLDAGAAAGKKSCSADSTSEENSVEGEGHLLPPSGQLLPPSGHLLPPSLPHSLALAETNGLKKEAGRANSAVKPSAKQGQPEKATPTSSWMQVHARLRALRCMRARPSLLLPFSTCLLVM